MKKSILAMVSIMAIGLLALGAFAYRGDYSAKGPNYSEERHELMEQAFDNMDYHAWKELMTQDGRHPRVVDVVTEENFATFVAAHDAGVSGDADTAAQLRAELGLGQGRQRNMGHGPDFIDADGDGICDNRGRR